MSPAVVKPLFDGVGLPYWVNVNTKSVGAQYNSRGNYVVSVKKRARNKPPNTIDIDRRGCYEC